MYANGGSIGRDGLNYKDLSINGISLTLTRTGRVQAGYPNTHSTEKAEARGV